MNSFISKRIYPKKEVLSIADNNLPIDGSITSINNEYFNERNQSCADTQSTKSCSNCKTVGSSVLLSVCNCQHKLFHENCVKQWLQIKISKNGQSIKSSGDGNYLLCPECKSQIKFKVQTKNRMRSFKEVHEYCGEKKLNIAFIALGTTLIVGCLIYLILLALNVAIICYNCTMQEKIVMVGLGVAIGLLFIVLFCCCHDCIIITETKVQTLYYVEDRNYRLGRLKRKDYLGSSGGSTSIQTKKQNQKVVHVEIIQ